jgi:prefoldin subunit 5
MPKKIITPEEFNELSKVMDERDIIEQYNIAVQNQTNIFQKLKKHSADSIGFVIGNLGLLKKIVVPIFTLAIIGGGYYGYQKYTEQIGWYKWQVNELEGKLGQEQGNVKDNESKISKLQTDLDDKTNKIKSVEKSVSDLESKVSDKESIIIQLTYRRKLIASAWLVLG